MTEPGPKPPTIGQIIADLPVGVWLDLSSEHGCWVRHFEDPVRVDIVPIPVVHTTTAEFATERFWAERIDPVARANGIDPTNGHFGLRIDAGDSRQRLLVGSDGMTHLIVRVEG